jgi:hypothetical protein
MSFSKIYHCRLPGLKIHQGLIREVGRFSPRRFTVWQTSCRQTEAANIKVED